MPEDEETVAKRPLTTEEKASLAAQARKFDAEAAAASAAAAKSAAEARKAAAEAAAAEIGLAQVQRVEAEHLASDKYHHVYQFTGSVGQSSVKDCVDRLAYWRRSDPKQPITIVFNSPGGSVLDGMVLFDYIQDLRRHGTKVTTVSLGMAASMAGILLQAGDVRIMAKESWMLIHEIAFGAIGKIGDVEDTVEWAKRIQDRILNIFANRCKAAGEAGTASKPLTKSKIEKEWKRRDWWISSEEALEYGLIDGIDEAPGFGS